MSRRHAELVHEDDVRAAAKLGVAAPNRWFRVPTPGNLNLHLMVTEMKDNGQTSVLFRYNGKVILYCESEFAEFRNVSEWTAKQVHIAQDIVGKPEDDGFSITHRNGTVYICGDPALGDTHRVQLHKDSQTWSSVSP